jgi:UDP-N-acetyl-2-amino-2-deoxyglucuronate dehydrogenase
MMDKIRVGIIGCGAISSIHMEGVAACVDTQLEAVCDIDGVRAAAAAEKYGCKAYTNYRELLEDRSIDSVHICTPHYLHAPIAIAAMQMGKHVLCEKPIAVSTAAAWEMIQVSEETGKRLGICFQNRYNATSVRIRELLDAGTLGKIRGARAIVTWHREGAYYTESEWRGTWEKEGGGVLINQSIHTLDLVQWLLGEIVAIKGNVDTRLLGDIIEVEDTADATIRFKNGAAALFYATNCYAADAPVEVEIVCEKAVLRLEGDLTITWSDGRKEQVSETDLRTGEKAYWGSGHAALIEDYYRKLKAALPFPIDGHEGIKALQMIEAIYQSSKTREYAEIGEGE